MAYGIVLYNDNDELTLSDQGRVFGYIGKATLYTIVQPTMEFREDFYFGEAGYSVYKIDWPADIIPIIPLSSNGGVKLLDYNRSGNTWTIIAHKAKDAFSSTMGYTVEEPLDIYVFGAPVGNSTAGLWGVALYDDNQNLVGDLSRRPLNFVKFALINGESSIDISNIIKPGIIGSNISSMSATISNNGGTREYWSSFIKSGNIITNQYYMAGSLTTTPEGSGGSNFIKIQYQSSALIIELNGL